MRLAGLEPAAQGLGTPCSVHLSYRRISARSVQKYCRRDKKKVTELLAHSCGGMALFVCRSSLKMPAESPAASHLARHKRERVDETEYLVFNGKICKILLVNLENLNAVDRGKGGTGSDLI